MRQVRNWMFTLFYVAAEMWGDVVLSLLFWGLANETTTIREAPLLYPLFGIGANIGQTVSGKALSSFSTWAAPHISYATQLQVCCRAFLHVSQSFLLCANCLLSAYSSPAAAQRIHTSFY